MPDSVEYGVNKFRGWCLEHCHQIIDTTHAEHRPDGIELGQSANDPCTVLRVYLNHDVGGDLTSQKVLVVADGVTGNDPSSFQSLNPILSRSARDPNLRPNALESGADYVTQSTHKMLSAFSQASMIHVSDPDFDEHRFRENLNMHTSTSPQYALIASLDVARKQMSIEGVSRRSLCIETAARLRSAIDQTNVFSVLTLSNMLPQELLKDNVSLDPTKLTIDCSRSGFTARKIQLALFEHYGIQVEKVTHNTVSILVTLGTTDSKVLRLLRALQALAIKAPGDGATRITAPATLPKLRVVTAGPADSLGAVD